MRRFVTFVQVVFVFGCIFATPAAADDGATCDDFNFPSDATITACTRLIESEELGRRDLAVTYSNRGLAYNNKGGYDLAIADTSQAIRLDPNNSLAYNNRGLAHINSGD